MTVFRPAVLGLLAALAGCGNQGPDGPTLDGTAPELNGTLQPDDGSTPPADLSPETTLDPNATLEPDATLQPDTTAAP